MGRKLWAAAAVVALIGTSSPAVAAELSNANGQSCGDGVGLWHFVNNQTGGAPAGTLTAYFDDGGVTEIQTTGPSKTTSSTQHFYVSSAGTLVSATTGSLPGKLVLSDFTCDTGVKK